MWLKSRKPKPNYDLPLRLVHDVIIFFLNKCSLLKQERSSHHASISLLFSLVRPTVTIFFAGSRTPPPSSIRPFGANTKNNMQSCLIHPGMSDISLLRSLKIRTPIYWAYRSEYSDPNSNSWSQTALVKGRNRGISLWNNPTYVRIAVVEPILIRTKIVEFGSKTASEMYEPSQPGKRMKSCNSLWDVVISQATLKKMRSWKFAPKQPERYSVFLFRRAPATSSRMSARSATSSRRATRGARASESATTTTTASTTGTAGAVTRCSESFGANLVHWVPRHWQIVVNLAPNKKPFYE